ncbi:MAG: alcohol dehydrogenase catalytic domain-containing protein, partial [Lachnospiraceae bacterium]|nr:alcohol dehydrogenase catalytic domain-containing protein [Lachnospiraceae bacterium]
MKAWVLEDIGNFTYKETDPPKPQKDEALVRVRNCGICGSDIPRVYKDGAHVMPLVIGHEFSGEVVSAGDDSNRNWEGKRVGIYPLIPCMRCPQCLEGHFEMCRNYGYLGSRRDGGFAEYAAVPVWNLIDLPDSVSFEQAAMLEPMAVASHAIRSLSVSKRDTIAVYGQGTIGLFITMLLLAEGHTDVFVFANHELQIEKALQLGVPDDNICNIRNNDPLKWAFERTCGRGFDSSFEAVGSSVT